MLKRLLCFTLILGLLALSGCQPHSQVVFDYPDETEKDQPVENGEGNQNNSDEEPDLEKRQPSVDTENPAEQVPTDTEDAPEEKEPPTTAISVEQNRYGVKLKYQFDNEDSKILAKFINGLTFDGDMCKCIGPDYLILGEKRYNVAIAEWSDDCHIRINGKQKNLTKTERDQILAIFRRQLTSKNRLPLEEIPSMMISGPPGRFELKDERTVQWMSFFDSLEYTTEIKELKGTYTINFDTYYFWADLEGKRPYVINVYNKKANLNSQQVAEIQSLLAASCLETDRYTPPPREDKDAYVVVYGEPTRQYKFRNDDSRALRDLLDDVFTKGEKKTDVKCKATYRIYYQFYLYLSVQEDGSAYLYYRDSEKYAVATPEDTAKIISLFSPYCIDDNEVRYYE